MADDLEARGKFSAKTGFFKRGSSARRPGPEDLPAVVLKTCISHCNIATRGLMEPQKFLKKHPLKAACAALHGARLRSFFKRR